MLTERLLYRRVSGNRVEILCRLTFNEPWCTAVLGYGNGEHAPGRTSADASEVYRAGHNLLLAHAHAVDVYRTQYQPTQKGQIGITLNGNWTGILAIVTSVHLLSAQVDSALGFVESVYTRRYHIFCFASWQLFSNCIRRLSGRSIVLSGLRMAGTLRVSLATCVSGNVHNRFEHLTDTKM